MEARPRGRVVEPDRHPATISVWDDARGQTFARIAGDVAADICVVGLGVSGLCATIEAAALGRTVVGLDAGTVVGGAAGRNGGILRAGLARFHHEAVQALGRERAAALYRLTAAEIDRAAAETPGAVRRTGSLRVAADDEEWADCVAQAAALRADGVEVQERDTAFGHGLFIPHDAAVHPVVRGRALAARATAAGVRLYEHSPVVALSHGEVRTPGGRVRCGAIVIAVDGGLEELVPALRGHVRTARLQMLATESDPAVQIVCPVSLNHGFDYGQQLSDGRIALGGGRNRSFDTEWGAPAEPSDAIQAYLDTLLRERIGSRARVTHRWAARVAYTVSGLPVLAEVERDMWAVGGYNGTGNLMGALCARAAAQFAAGAASSGATRLAMLLSEAAS